MPTVQASSSALYSSTWVGVDGYTNEDLIQTGTSQDTSDGYYAWIEILPESEVTITNGDGRPATVEPGDQILASVAEVSEGVWTIFLDDETQDWYFEQNYYYDGPASSAEWVEEAPTVGGSISTLADFGTVAFTETVIYGDLGSDGTTWYGTNMTSDNAIDMINAADTYLLASPSAPTSSTSGGQQFTDTYDDTPLFPPPAAPTNLTATPVNNGVTLSWTASETDGGPAPTYTATVGPNSCVTTSESCTVTGLVNGQTYSATVYGTNVAGPGPAATPISALAAGPPGAPTIASVVGEGSSAVVTVTPPTDDGGAPVETYTYFWWYDGDWHQAGTTTATSQPIDGLPVDASVSYYVEATNISGTSSMSAPFTTTLPAPPNAPTSVVAVGHQSSVAVRWTAAATGAAATGFTAYASAVGYLSPHATTCSTVAATHCTITGLAERTTYYVWVSATNTVGATASVGVKTKTAAVAVGAPGKVTNLRGSATRTSVTLRWSAPRDVGAGVGSYLVDEYQHGAWVQIAAPTRATITVSSLAAHGTYKFEVVVYAVNGQESLPVEKSVTTS